MKCAIVGAGEVGLFLCKHLLQKDHELVLIEKNKALAKYVSDFLNARIVTGDATLVETLQKIELQTCDAFLAMTQDDAANVLACTLAKSLGAKKTICRIHHTLLLDTQNFNYQSHFGIDHFIDTQQVCAIEIAKYMRAPHRVAVEHFSRGKVDIQTLELSQHSTWVGKELQRLNLNGGIRIGLIQREGRYLIPMRDTVLQGEDLLTLAGDYIELSKLRAVINPKESALTRVVLFSASDVSLALLRLLNNPRFKLKVIEENLETCMELAENHPNISIVHGNATSLPLLLEEQISEADYFVACSNDDEKNIIASLQAKKVGAKNVHLWVNKEDYEAVCDSLQSNLNIDHLVLTKHSIVGDLDRILFPQPVSILGTLGEGEDATEILEIHLPSGTEIEGHTIDRIAWPERTILLVLNHRFHTKVPTAKDCLIGGDRVIAVVQKKHKNAIVRLLTTKITL